MVPNRISTYTMDQETLMVKFQFYLVHELDLKNDSIFNINR